MKSESLLFAALACCCLGQRPDLLDKPQSKADQLAKFHFSKRAGMSADLRLKGYDARVWLERQSPFQELKWRNIGPERQGGRVISIVAPANNPKEVYVAFATGGLWRTEDDGASWVSLFDRESSFGIGDVAVSKDGKTLWVGSGEANSSRTSYAGTGVFKSQDRGKTWKWMGLPESHHIGKILIDPKDENTVYVAALGHLYTQNDERGVYKTTDGGKTWTLILSGTSSAGAIDLTLAGDNLFAHIWDRRRLAWDFAESGPGSGLFRSKDGGKSWTRAEGLPSGQNLGRGGLVSSPKDPNRLYLTLDNQSAAEDDVYEDEKEGVLTPMRLLRLTGKQVGQLPKTVLDPFFETYMPRDEKLEEWTKDLTSGKRTLEDLVAAMKKRRPGLFKVGKVFDEVYRSEDGGATWKKAHAAGIGPDYGYYFNKIFVNPSNPNDVVLANFLLHRSKDGGRSWQQMAVDAHVDFHAVYFDPTDPNRILVGSDGGVYISRDGGKTFKDLNTLPVGQTTTLALDDRTFYHIYTGLQDNGTMEGPKNYVSGSSNPADWKTLNGGDGSAVAVDPSGDLVFTAYQFGGHSGLNRKTGESWTAAPTPTKDKPLRFNWISPLVISSHNSDIVYCGSQYLHRSFDSGKKYSIISPDLTKGKAAGNVPFSTLKDISESPLRFGLILTGADDGTVSYTPDGGYQWNTINTPTPDKWVSRVVTSKHKESVFYVAQNGYRDDDFSPYLWRSTDLGKTWVSIVGNLPAEPINVVREDPRDPNVLYVGTDMGVYFTRNLGRTWYALQGNMPHVAVHDLQIQAKANDLIVATHGRSIWILPLDPIEELTEDLLAKDLAFLPLESMNRFYWGRKQRAAYEVDEEEHKLNVRFISCEEGATELRLVDSAGKEIRKAKVNAHKGLNIVEFDLKDKMGLPIPPDLKPDPNNPLADLLEPYRPVFIAKGDYKLVLTRGGKKSEMAWKLKSE